MTVIFSLTPSSVPASIEIVWVNDDVEPREITFALTTLYFAIPAKSRTDLSSDSSESAFLRFIKSWRNFSFSALSFSISPRVRPSWVTSEKKLPTGLKIFAPAD